MRGSGEIVDCLALKHAYKEFIKFVRKCVDHYSYVLIYQ